MNMKQNIQPILIMNRIGLTPLSYLNNKNKLNGVRHGLFSNGRMSKLPVSYFGYTNQIKLANSNFVVQASEQQNPLSDDKLGNHHDAKKTNGLKLQRNTFKWFKNNTKTNIPKDSTTNEQISSNSQNLNVFNLSSGAKNSSYNNLKGLVYSTKEIGLQDGNLFQVKGSGNLNDNSLSPTSNSLTKCLEMFLGPNSTDLYSDLSVKLNGYRDPRLFSNPIKVGYTMSFNVTNMKPNFLNSSSNKLNNIVENVTHSHYASEIVEYNTITHRSDTSNDYINSSGQKDNHLTNDNLLIYGESSLGNTSPGTALSLIKGLSTSEIDCTWSMVVFKLTKIQLNMETYMPNVYMEPQDGAYNNVNINFLDITSPDLSRRLDIYKGSDQRNISVIEIPAGKERLYVNFAKFTLLSKLPFKLKSMLAFQLDDLFLQNFEINDVNPINTMVLISSDPVKVQNLWFTWDEKDLLIYLDQIQVLFTKLIPHRISAHNADTFIGGMLHSYECTYKYGKHNTLYFPRQNLPSIIGVFAVYQPQTYGLIKDDFNYGNFLALNILFSRKLIALAGICYDRVMKSAYTIQQLQSSVYDNYQDLFDNAKGEVFSSGFSETSILYHFGGSTFNLYPLLFNKGCISGLFKYLYSDPVKQLIDYNKYQFHYYTLMGYSMCNIVDTNLIPGLFKDGIELELIPSLGNMLTSGSSFLDVATFSLGDLNSNKQIYKLEDLNNYHFINSNDSNYLITNPIERDILVGSLNNTLVALYISEVKTNCQTILTEHIYEAPINSTIGVPATKPYQDKIVEKQYSGFTAIKASFTRLAPIVSKYIPFTPEILKSLNELDAKLLADPETLILTLRIVTDNKKPKLNVLYSKISPELRLTIDELFTSIGISVLFTPYGDTGNNYDDYEGFDDFGDDGETGNQEDFERIFLNQKPKYIPPRTLNMINSSNKMVNSNIAEKVAHSLSAVLNTLSPKETLEETTGGECVLQTGIKLINNSNISKERKELLTNLWHKHIETSPKKVSTMFNFFKFHNIPAFWFRVNKENYLVNTILRTGGKTSSNWVLHYEVGNHVGKLKYGVLLAVVKYINLRYYSNQISDDQADKQLGYLLKVMKKDNNSKYKLLTNNDNVFKYNQDTRGDI